MPEFQIKGSHYIFEWPEYLLQAEVSRINENHESVKCQIVFTTTDPADDPHLLQTRLTLDSSRSRSEVAKEMAGRYQCEGSSIDWKALLEYVSVKTIRESEKGDPVVEIHSTDEVKPLDYLIAPIIPLGKPSVFFGDPGAGKSQLAAVIVLLACFEGYVNPLRLTPPARTMRGLVLDWEADEDDWRRQLKWFTDIFGLGYAEMYYRRCSLSLAHDLDAIRAHIEEVKADYVIIDSVSLAAGGDLNHMDIATNYFRALRQLNMTTISLAHTSKDRENKSKTILGSVLFEAGARNVWEVRGQEDDNILDIGLFHRKSNLSKKHTPLGYRILYKPDPNNPSQTIPDAMVWHNPTNVAEFVERMGTNQRVIELLKEHPATDKDIIDLLGISRGNWRVTKSRLKSKNIITEVDGCNVLVTTFS